MTDTLLNDLDTGAAKDALPLLAFTIERLFREHGAAGNIALNQYTELGGVNGSIESAVERALMATADDRRFPLDRTIRLALLRRGLIPWLAGVDPETGRPRRRVALLSEIPDESRPMIDHLVDQRLLATDISPETGETTVEPAHEALLRQWGELRSWLAEDLGALTTLEGVKRASRDWASNGRNDEWIAHSGDRLKAADAAMSRSDLSKILTNTDEEYLAACRLIATARSRARRYAQVTLVSFALILCAGLTAWLNQTYLSEQWFWVTSVRNYILTEADEAALRSGRSNFKECSNCPEMVVIPPGEFLMGAPKGEGEKDEYPQHYVVISYAFAVSKFEITVDQWRACVSYGGCSKAGGPLSDNGRLPVNRVSWRDAQYYASWLSRITGKEYRLLSEAEWEYVARAGTKTRYPWGDEIGHGHANCNGCGSRWSGFQPAPVGSFKPNAFGIHDMHGNMFEWVEDCWNDNYVGAPADGSAWRSTAPRHGEHCSRRMIRGGSWYRAPQYMRSANRAKEADGNRYPSVGIRIARSIGNNTLN